MFQEWQSFFSLSNISVPLRYGFFQPSYLLCRYRKKAMKDVKKIYLIIQDFP